MEIKNNKWKHKQNKTFSAIIDNVLKLMVYLINIFEFKTKMKI